MGPQARGRIKLEQGKLREATQIAVPIFGCKSHIAIEHVFAAQKHSMALVARTFAIA
ncbi:hypothetical protein ACFOD4_10305 [Pseudoroseomonas globiformis]|uniref:Transposase n=1 Tax=Teichococcus globiformis TaxID=2307229 RepID=A0ABV7G1N0_9PROT